MNEIFTGSGFAPQRPGRDAGRCRSALWTSVLATVALATILSCSRPAHVVWERRFDSSHEDFGSSVATDSNNIIIGTTDRDTAAGPSRTDLELLRCDRNGNVQWRRSYPRGVRDSLAAVAVGADHDIVAVGCTGPNTAGDSVRLLLAKFSAQGDAKWSREYALGVATRGVALKLDSMGRITVCGSVNSDLLVACFDADGNLLDRETLDFGADVTGQDLIQMPSSGYSVRTSLSIIAGVRTPVAGKNDSSKTRDIVVACLDPDRNIIWRASYDSGGDDVRARLVWDQGPCMAVTSQTDRGTVTHLLEYGFWYHNVSILHETLYPGEPNASCLALTKYRNGGFLGVGAAGPNGHQHCLGWRYFRGKFETFLSGGDTLHGTNERADAVTTDADGNAVISGISSSGGSSGILLIKVAFPRYIPPPDLPYRVGHN